MNARQAVLSIALLAAVLYGGSLANEFVGDDFLVVVNNRFIRSASNLPKLFTRDYITTDDELRYEGLRDIGSGESSYRPVSTFSYFVDRALWGLKPPGWHLTNVLWHAAAAVCLYFLACAWIGPEAALLAALLFTAHPVNAEAVNLVSYREDLLATAFLLASFLFYLKARLRLAVPLYALALFAKESVIVFPALLAAHEWLLAPAPGDRAPRRWLPRVAPYALVACGYAAVWLYFTHDLGNMIAAPHGGWTVHAASILKVFGVYLAWMFAPVNVHVTAPEPGFLAHRLVSIEALGPLALFAAGLWLAWRLRRRSGWISFAILWFYVSWLPVSGILPTRHLIAARYLYLPVIGACLLLGRGLTRMGRIAPLAALVLFGTLTLTRNVTFHSNVLFWNEAARHAPHNPYVGLALAGNLFDKGRPEEAIRYYELAIRSNTDPALAHHGAALCYYRLGQFDKAVEYLRISIRLNPADLETPLHLGAALGRAGQPAESAAVLEDLLRVRPDAPVYHNLGVTYMALGRRQDAIRCWKKALELEPGNKLVKMHLALAENLV